VATAYVSHAQWVPFETQLEIERQNRYQDQDRDARDAQQRAFDAELRRHRNPC
jgi:hypothetical protein